MASASELAAVSAAPPAPLLASVFGRRAVVSILAAEDPTLVGVDETSRVAALGDQMKRSVVAWAARNNAVVLPRWIGAKKNRPRKYKQSTIFEMHNELGDSGAEVALRVSLKQKRIVQLELRF